ncbi:unnamed protein product [Urochloa decumbens]|uniref:Uncharacterized protein n=1 Tax=Urochloa decumbens TaxID=240449 RepID=A0ABC9G7P3_9POAL
MKIASSEDLFASSVEDSTPDSVDAVPHPIKEFVADSDEEMPDARDAVVRAPGAAAAWSKDGATDAVVRALGVVAAWSMADSHDAVVRTSGTAEAWSKDGASDAVVCAPDIDEVESMEEVPDCIEEVPDSIEDMPDIDEEVPDSIEEVPDSVEAVPDSVDEVPDIDEVVDCPRCKTFHTGGVYGEACRKARRDACRCARCGLLHEEYGLTAQVFDGMENFDCKIYIPVVEELQLDGNTIILPEQVVQKLDEMEQARKRAKANKEGEASKQ